MKIKNIDILTPIFSQTNKFSTILTKPILTLLVIFSGILDAHSHGFRPFAVVNDDCINAIPINFINNGYSPEIVTTTAVDLTMATKELGEHFQYPALNGKSVWFSFSIPVNRQVGVEILASVSPELIGWAVYNADNCLPIRSQILLNNDKTGFSRNPCLPPGNYKIQVTCGDTLSTEIQVKINLDYNLDPNTLLPSKHDNPSNAYNFGTVTGVSTFSTNPDPIVECHSLDTDDENSCLSASLPNFEEYQKSLWFVFTTDDYIDILHARINTLGSLPENVGYRLFEGDSRNFPLYLNQIDCGLTHKIINYNYFEIEWSCILQPNTTYTLLLFFPQDYSTTRLDVSLRQRGEQQTRWPMPTLPGPPTGSNLGLLPQQILPQSLPSVTFSDYLSCNARLALNPCPPANLLNGVQIGATTYELSTWFTFTLSDYANVEFNLPSNWLPNGAGLVRIFKKGLSTNCPSPDPLIDMDTAFINTTKLRCMSPGDYAVQILGREDYYQSANNWKSGFDNGALGKPIEIRIFVDYQPDQNPFDLASTGSFDTINGLNPLLNNVLYSSQYAELGCKNTVEPDDTTNCGIKRKAIYRELIIASPGLLTIGPLRTSFNTPPYTGLNYKFYQADANQLATAQNAHLPGQKITGLATADYLGICIDQYRNSTGNDNFCMCISESDTFTLVSLGDEPHSGRGDQPSFQWRNLNTVYDSRANAETLDFILNTATSQPDVFSCSDNLPAGLPSCSARKKVIFRQFYLSNPKEVEIIKSPGDNSGSVFSLFSGQASDLTQSLLPIAECFTTGKFLKICEPLPAGWYTLVAYGEGPNYTDKKIWNPKGDPQDVGKTSQIMVRLSEPSKPKYNRPNSAYYAGITDWSGTLLNCANAITAQTYALGSDTLGPSDAPVFIPGQLGICEQGYNRVSFYVFTITKNSFLEVQDVLPVFYTQIFPFDVRSDSNKLLTVQPVYPCLQRNDAHRQICDLPPGTYTLAVFAPDNMECPIVKPTLYLDAVMNSKYDFANNAYDFGIISGNSVYQNGRLNDLNSDCPTQAPSRDVFYCTTGAHATNPTESQCGTILDTLVYSGSTPRPLYTQTYPLAGTPPAQAWRNLWYTFVLTGSGEAKIKNELPNWIYDPKRPYMAVYESDVNGSIPFNTLKTMPGGVDSMVAMGLTLVAENLRPNCGVQPDTLTFQKNGCQRDTVRYYVVVSQRTNTLPNQPIDLSIKYTGEITYPALYDEQTTANVIGLGQSQPPYTSIVLNTGNYQSVPFSLLCYTENVTDPGNCTGGTGQSAWFKFEIGSSGFLKLSLEEIGILNGYFADLSDLTLWYEAVPGGQLVQRNLIRKLGSSQANHNRLEGCIEPGTYFLLVRSCNDYISLIQSYRVLLELSTSPGDYCSNAIPVVVSGSGNYSGVANVDCHTIGIDFGESSVTGMDCLIDINENLNDLKTSWFHVIVPPGPKLDLTFSVTEGTQVDINKMAYRLLYGSCNAITPGTCNPVASNVFHQSCLAPGDYYVQISEPKDAIGSITLNVLSIPSADQNCNSVDPGLPHADFIYNSDCQTISFINLSTSGSDITYLWEFPDGSSSEINPIWTPLSGAPPYTITLTVTNVVLNIFSTVTKTITVNNTFPDYTELTDTIICNDSGPVFLDATVMGATYIWDDGSTSPTRIIDAAGNYWVDIFVDDCELRDYFVLEKIIAQDTIAPTICNNASITLNGQVFDINNPAGIVILQNAHPRGCDSILIVNLSFHPSLNTQYSSTICQGETFPFNNQNLTQSGIYNDTIVSSNGCDSIVTLTLTVIPQQIISKDISGCVGSSLALMPATLGTSYVWSNGATTNTLIVNTSGSYTVSISDIATCIIAVETFTVTFGELSSPNITTPNPVCLGSDVILTATGSTGLYRWFDQETGGNLLGTGSSFSISNVVEETTIYVEAFQAGSDSCVSMRVPVTVMINVEPVKISSVDTIICAGSTFTLPWGEMVTPLTAASFTNVLTYMVSGCDSLILTVNIDIEQPEIQYDISDYVGFGVTCFGSEDGFIIVDVHNGTSPYKFLWNTGDTSSALIDVPAGTYNITVTSANGCEAFGSIVLLEPPALSLFAEKRDLTCFGAEDGTIIAMASGGVPDYNFNLNGGGTQLSSKFENLLSGSYTLIATDSRGCIDSVMLNLTEPDEIVLDLIAVSPLCPTDIPTGSISAMAFGGQPPILYSIGNGTYTSLSEFNQLIPGLYKVSAQDAAGCQVTDEIEVLPTLSLPLIMPPILTLQLGDSVQLIPQIGFLADSILWSPPLGLSCFDCPEPWAKPDQSTNYLLTLWSKERCLVSGTVQLNVDFSFHIYIPNGFTPNGDGVNDAFSVYANSAVKIVRSLSIFDRWGNALWQAQNFIPDGSTGWDGLSRGMPMTLGVYIWKCEIELIDGRVEVLAGDVTLLR